MDKLDLRIYINDITLDACSYSKALIDVLELKDWILKVINLGATHIEPSVTSDYDGEIDDVILTAYCCRKETDDEFDKRMKMLSIQIKKDEEAKDATDRALYERLKKKFEQK